MNKMILNLPILEDLPARDETHLLNGMQGTNRGQKTNCQIEADNDFDAINTWLNEYKHKPSTHRVYQKEAERLLLWCIYQHKKPLSSLKRDDFDAYIEFLKNPQPHHIWVGKKGGRGSVRGSQSWKPFSSPLNSISINAAITIINSLMTYLTDAGYLQANPLRLLKKKRQKIQFEERKLNVQARILEQDEWQAMLETLNNMPEKEPHDRDEKYRLRFIVAMLFFLGLRVGELTSHTWQAFRQIEGNWWFVVKGKGDKWGKIPVNDELFKIVTEFRAHLRLHPMPQAEDNFALVPSWRSREGLTARHINHLLKKLAFETGEKHFSDDINKRKKLSKFSAHWLRHLSATMQDREGIPFSQVRSNMRHENDETTRLYIHVDDQLRHKMMQKVTLS